MLRYIHYQEHSLFTEITYPSNQSAFFGITPLCLRVFVGALMGVVHTGQTAYNIENACVRFVLGLRRFDHITDKRIILGWMLLMKDNRWFHPPDPPYTVDHYYASPDFVFVYSRYIDYPKAPQYLLGNLVLYN